MNETRSDNRVTHDPERRILLSLAPMAGYTDEAFRMICQAYGAEETVTEMVSARGLYHQDQKTPRLMATDPSEKGVTLQIFGSEPEILVAVVKEQLNARDDFVCIDINMGCPVPKIVKNGEGAALLRDPDQAARVAEAVVKASNKPVSVKIRTGWDHHTKNYLVVGKQLEQAGIARLTIHGRTRSQFYTGTADWEAIAELAEVLHIPVIGNGDIADVETALARVNSTCVQGIAIGRGAVGNPFVFAQIRDVLTGKAPQEPTLEERIDCALRHLALCVQKKGETLAVVQMRKHLLAYVKGWHGAGALKQAILQETTQAGIEQVFRSYVEKIQTENFEKEY